jgi:hypothetical protein
MMTVGIIVAGILVLLGLFMSAKEQKDKEE